MNNNRCIACGRIIPEGIVTCPICEMGTNIKNTFDKEDDMIETVVKINSDRDVEEFCDLCSKCKDNVLLYSGKHVVSAKSVIEMLSIDLNEPLKIEFHGRIPHEVREGMKKYIVD